MSPMSPFSLTFNRPAVHSFFEGEDADGLKVSIQESGVVFTPVQGSRDPDVIPLEERKRGGIKATVEGKMAKQLALALENPHGPYFTLRRMRGGSVGAVPYESTEAPSKFSPHMRTWFAHSADADTPPAVMPSMTDFPQFLEAVRNAKRVVDENSKVRRAGRPSKEVAEAKRLLAQFRELALEISPVIEKDEKLLREAHELIGTIIGTAAPVVETKKARAPAAKKAPVRVRKASTELAVA